MQDKITIADAPDCLNTNDKAMWVLGYEAALEARGQCLHQIQEPAKSKLLEAKPAFYTAIAEHDGDWIPLPEYSAQTSDGVLQRVLARAREEGYQGGNALERLKELGWAYRPVYFAVDPAQVAPLPLLIRDIARDHGITALEACQALKDLGNFSVNTAVTAEMAAKLRELFPVPQAAPAAVAVPDGWQLVPVKVTKEMLLAAGFSASAHGGSTTGHEKWEAFLTNAPAPPSQTRAALAATLTALATDRHASVERLSEAARNTLLLDPCKNTPELDAAVAAYLAAPPAAAPVVLPEPDAAISEIMELVEKASVQRASMAVLIYTEQPKEFSDKAAAQERDTVKLIETKLRALLAGVSAPAAQAVASIYVTADGQRECDDWRVPLPIGRNLLYTAPQAQADARDAQLLAFAVSEIRRDGMGHAPVLYVSKGQLNNHRDPDGPDSTAHGRYLPARITPAGKFTTPLFAVPHALTPAARDVLAERQRQITQEGYDPQHDDDHVNDEIAAMAALFIMPEGAREWDATSTSYGDTLAEAILPCDWEMPNFGDDRRRQLVKGTAMGLAEIERIDRAAIAAAKGEGQ